jgi:hypothetical protein
MVCHEKKYDCDSMIEKKLKKTTKPFQDLINKEEKIYILCLARNYLGNSNFNILFFFFKIYSNATNENMILKLIQ